MRVLLVADGRSPITRRWIEALGEAGVTTGLLSTFPTGAVPGVAFQGQAAVAFARWAAGKPGGDYPTKRASAWKRVARRARGLLLAGRYWLGPASLSWHTGALVQALDAFQPDLVHALRIPFEGMLAAEAPARYPLAVSIWGNDLTLHARGSPSMAGRTARCLRRAAGLLADAARDVRLARAWGLREQAPTAVLPGSGGLPLAELEARAGCPVEDLLPFPLPAHAHLVVNPRGFRPGSVLQETFFAAAPLILRQNPDAVLVCPAMAGQPQAERWKAAMRQAGFGNRVALLPVLPQPRLWDLLHRARVFVSPSRHDGTPNSLLEAMACGCLPVVGDIESTREWITPGRNGLLVDPASPPALAEAVLLAQAQEGLCSRAANENQALVAQRASRDAVRQRLLRFYEECINQ